MSRIERLATNASHLRIDNLRFVKWGQFDACLLQRVRIISMLPSRIRLVGRTEPDTSVPGPGAGGACIATDVSTISIYVGLPATTTVFAID